MEKYLELCGSQRGKFFEFKLEFYGDSILRIKNVNKLMFQREFVSQNRPCIITDEISHWNALDKWDFEYLAKKLKNVELTVDITPNGLADSIVKTEKGSYFLQPYKTKMTIDQFVKNYKRKNIHYIQHQNDNFRNGEFANLQNDVEVFDWSTEIFGEPDAVNIWMGDKRSITSLHKDHYENLYSVIRGVKHFTLYPPAYFGLLYQKVYPCGRYNLKDEDWEIIYEEDKVPWISVDPLNPNYEEFPLFKYAKPYQVEIKQGEVLYLPSLWFHHVQQTEDKEGKMIAVNYWYDMVYGPSFNYFKFIENQFFDFEKN